LAGPPRRPGVVEALSDVYRTSAIACPRCPGASLREFKDRFVCDECQGLLIGFDDFASACEDLTGELATLEYRDEAPTTRPCPTCGKPLVACKLTLVSVDRSLKLGDEVLRCESHGLWCGGGVLASVFARITRRLIANRRPHVPGEIGLDGLPRTRVAPATAGLVIGNWHARKRARPKTLTPVNAYADRELACPTCSTRLSFLGDRWACAECHGSFVETAALVAMVSDVSKQPWEMPEVSGAPGPRGCPICHEALVVESLSPATIDRCPRHGVWFDADELAAALERASGAFPEAGLGPWLKRLFT
jgi:hypothetical protein